MKLRSGLSWKSWNSGTRRASFIAVARIAGPGEQGGLADLHTHFPDRFDGLEEVWLESADGGRKP